MFCLCKSWLRWRRVLSCSSRSRFGIPRLSGFRQAICRPDKTPKVELDRVDQVITTGFVQKGF